MRIQKIYYDTFLDEHDLVEKARNDYFKPVTVPSQDYKTWRAVLDLKTCFNCADNHGRIFDINDSTVMLPPLHLRCRCTLENVEAIESGNATNNGTDGADYWLKYFKILPSYYI